MTLITRAAEWLGVKLQDVAGRTVTLLRNEREDTLTGTVSKQEYAYIDDDGFSVVAVVYDWIFTTDELPYEFRPGDAIRETLNGETIEYEVLPIANKPCSEWCDTSGILTMAHCPRIKRV